MPTAPDQKSDSSDVDWIVAGSPVDYPHALSTMECRAADIVAGTAPELVWLIEHPPLYTSGTSADPRELLDARFPVYRAGRGGRFTYHGPGQRIGYVMLNLNQRGRDIRAYVHALEGWVIAALRAIGIDSHRAPGRIGIWTDTPGGEAKIGAIGVRVHRWVTLHGISINIDPDLSHFGGIVPCGLPDFAVTSVRALGNPAPMTAIDQGLATAFPALLAALSPPHAKKA